MEMTAAGGLETESTCIFELDCALNRLKMLFVPRQPKMNMAAVVKPEALILIPVLTIEIQIWL